MHNLAADANRPPPCRLSYPTPPRGWCALLLPLQCHRTQHCGRRPRSRQRPAVPACAEIESRRLRAPTPGGARRAKATAPADQPRPRFGAAATRLACAAVRPQTRPAGIARLTACRRGVAGQRRHPFYPGVLPRPQPRSLRVAQHARRALRSRGSARAACRARPAHRRYHVGRAGHGCRGAVFHPVRSSASPAHRCSAGRPAHHGTSGPGTGHGPPGRARCAADTAGPGRTDGHRDRRPGHAGCRTELHASGRMGLQRQPNAGPARRTGPSLPAVACGWSRRTPPAPLARNAAGSAAFAASRLRHRRRPAVTGSRVVSPAREAGEAANGTTAWRSRYLDLYCDDPESGSYLLWRGVEAGGTCGHGRAESGRGRSPRG